MWKPLRSKVVLTVEDVLAVLVRKEAELIIAQMQLQQATKIIEQYRVAQQSQSK